MVPSLGDLPVKDGFRLRGLEMTRLETFTDAAFAFALTLLVISLEPPTTTQEMMDAIKDIPSFLGSAALLMMFWYAHHIWSRRYGLDDGKTVLLSFGLVAIVLIYVVPLRFMLGVAFTFLSQFSPIPLSSGNFEIGGLEDVGQLFFVYAIGFTAMCVMIVLLYRHALSQRDELQLDELEIYDTMIEIRMWSVVAGVGALSMILAVVLPTRIILFGIPGWTYMLLPVLTTVVDRRSRPERERIQGEVGR